MSELREFPKQDKRVETGAVQFGDDWPGVFIRGDNSLMWAHFLEQYLNSPSVHEFNKKQLMGLVRLLRECDYQALLDAENLERKL